MEKGKILIVEDDDSLRDALMDILRKEEYTIIASKNGREAQQMIDSVPDLKLVISDVRMPMLNGIELLHWIKNKTKTLPVILTSGFSEVLGAADALELGASDFIPKPFDPNEVFQSIKRILHSNTAIAQIDLDSQFCKIEIDNFITGKDILFDIFIRISKKKYIKIIKKYEAIPIDRIKAYKTKNVHFLYLKKEDFTKYVGFNMNLVTALSKSERVDLDKKRRYMKQAGEVMLEKLYVDKVDPETFDHAKDYIKSVNSVLFDHSSAMELLFQLNQNADFIHSHSLGVSMYSVMISKEIQWSTPQTIFKVALGGLFHDIGKKEIDPQILKKPKKYLSREEASIIEAHPLRGVEILQEVADFPSDVIKIVHQHHEEVSGKGYPLGLRRQKIHPLARLIAVANVFCDIAITNPQSPGMAGADALKIMKDQLEALDPVPFAALIRLFKLNPKDFGVEDLDSDGYSWSYG